MKIEFDLFDGDPEFRVERWNIDEPITIHIDYRLTLLEIHASAKMLLTPIEHAEYVEVMTPKSQCLHLQSPTVGLVAS